MALSRKKKIVITVAAVAVVAIVVIISIAAGRKDVPEVTVVRVDQRPELRSTVTASGEVRPANFINLTSEVAGRIEEIFVNPGDHVSKGQALVRLDPTQLQSGQEAQAAAVQAAYSDVQNARVAVTSAENNVAQQQQALNVAQASLAQTRQAVVASQTSVDRAQVDLNTAQRELKRTTQLVESGVSSRSEFDAARDRVEQTQVALRTAQAQLEQQKIAVEEAKARVNQAQVNVRDSQIGVQRAQQSVKSSEAHVNQQQAVLRGDVSLRNKSTQYSPLDGVVADIPARQGQYALANFSSTPLMTIADMSAINVEVNVDETEIKSVKEGQVVKIKVDAMGDKELEGTVKEKNPLAIGKSQTTSGGLQDRVNVQEAKEFKVVIALDMSKLPQEVRDALRPGMTATATITTDTKKEVLAVPLQAVIEKPAPTPTPVAGATPQGNVPAPAPNGEKPKDIKGVYILQGNKVKFVEVATGITGESDIEITSGLKAGDEVVTGPSRVLRTLKDGAVIQRQTHPPGADNTNANAAK